MQTSEKLFLSSKLLKYAITLGLFTISLYSSHAQVIPLENDSVNYRIVGFEVPAMAKAKQYTVEIALGNFDKERLFKKHIAITAKDTTNQVIITLPAWGAVYTWRVKYTDAKEHEIDVTPLHHFRTLVSKYSDTSLYKTLVITKSEKYKDILILQDFAPVMYDANGELVWFIPDIPGIIGQGRSIRNLQPTNTGTFTLQNDYGAFEFDYHGKILWRAPDKGTISGDTSEHYHHDFIKLQNGHYLITGTEIIQRPVPLGADTTNFKSDNTVVRKDGIFYKKIDCPTLIEFSADSQIVWSWKSSQHIDDRDYFMKKFPSGQYNSNPHLNSFYFDEKHRLIYLSFRNYSRVVKLEYPSGKIVANYAGAGIDEYKGEVLFRAQHNVSLTTDGDIYMFDNNTDRERNVESYVRIFREDTANATLVKIWDFSCKIDSFADACGQAGGSVFMLQDRDILVSMGNAGRTFIVSHDKKILFNMVHQRKEGSGGWVNQVQYRSKCIVNLNYIKKYLFR
jgi:hypothetical protein